MQEADICFILSCSEQKLQSALRFSIPVHLGAPRMVFMVSFWIISGLADSDGDSSCKDKKSRMERIAWKYKARRILNPAPEVVEDNF